MKPLAGAVFLLIAVLSTADPTLRLDPAAGTMVLDTARASTAIPGLWLDGAFQKNFEQAGSDRFRNDAVDLAVERLSAVAIAATWTPRDRRLHEFRLRIKSDDDTEYYGTGERFQAVNQRGFILPLQVDDRYGNKGVGSHKPIPFFISSKGFGVCGSTTGAAPNTPDRDSSRSRPLSRLEDPASRGGSRAEYDDREVPAAGG